MFAIRFFLGIDFGRAHAGGGVVSKTYESLGLVWQVPQTDSSCVKRAEPLEKQKRIEPGPCFDVGVLAPRKMRVLGRFLRVASAPPGTGDQTQNLQVRVSSCLRYRQ